MEEKVIPQKAAVKEVVEKKIIKIGRPGYKV
jgi:hypothetical protein